MKGHQMGGSEVGNNLIGYSIDQDPGPILLVEPTEGVAKRYSRQRIDPMIETSPGLASKVSKKKSKSESNTMLEKDFPGGMLMITGANSGAGLRSMPIRRLILDEVDGYPYGIDEEGDPCLIAEARTSNFERTKKILYISTPTIKGRSRIEKEFNQTDRRMFYVPCPKCRFEQVIVWNEKGFRGIVWDEGKPETAHMVCRHCGESIAEHHKTWMLANGKWIPTAKADDPRARGYLLPTLYSPIGFISWEKLARLWTRKHKNVNELREFVNLYLAETWEERGDAPEWETIYNRREQYRVGTVPKGGLVLTAGADVQMNRIEVEIVAWGPRLESWSVDYRVIPGDTATVAPWKQLEELLIASWPHESGASMKLRMLAVDSGYNSQVVYRWVRRQRPDQVIAIKGVERFPLLIGPPKSVEVNERGRKVRRGVNLWLIGTDVAKKELYGFLRLDKPTHPERDGYPPGFSHFPEYGEDYFNQLTAEQLVLRVDKRNYRRYIWQQVRERNEALDARVYARAAAAIIGVDRWSEENWNRLAQALGASPVTPQAEPERTRGEFMKRFRDKKSRGGDGDRGWRTRRPT